MTPHGIAGSIRFRSRVLSFDAPVRRGDHVVDAEGAFVLPGLVNAHDHLELNHYGPLKVQERYANASAWVDDLRPLVRRDAEIQRRRSHPLRARLFIGGLKNLLAGVTTVAHHNPRYREIDRRFPVRVPARYGWAHSFALEREPVGAHGEPGGDVLYRCRTTPSDRPFIVHAAEGVDAAAAAEFDRMDALGCVRPNTVIVHGVALDARACRRLVACGGGLVWCPVSNQFLFGQTAPVRALLDAAQGRPAVCLGTDSRLTGARDLLEELTRARDLAPVSAAELLQMVTVAPAHLLRLPWAGRLIEGGSADLIVLPPSRSTAEETLLASSRRDLLLVVVGGRPAVAAAPFAGLLGARQVSCRRINIDGSDRVCDARLADAVGRLPIGEPGVECLE